MLKATSRSFLSPLINAFQVSWRSSHFTMYLARREWRVVWIPSAEEIENVVIDINPSKALGPDGMTRIFFKKLILIDCGITCDRGS